MHDPLAWLFALEQFGIKFGLENISRIVARLGHPERAFQSVHIAGTNGKGSVTAMVDATLRAAGHRSARYTSPHLVDLTERFVIDGRPVADAALADAIGDVRIAVDGLLGDGGLDVQPTFFEVTTAIAFELFRRADVEVAVLEVGLGGRLDATNVVSPPELLVTAITSIAFDHQLYLGTTLREIAFEKAGIIKPGVPVITAAEPGRGLEVIANVAQQLDSQLTVIDRIDARGAFLDEARLPLLGEHQRLNAAVAVATVRAAESRIPVAQETILTGLSRVQWPGRMQLATIPGGQTLLLDGAHNIPSAEALAAAFKQQFSAKQPAMIFGVLADKDWRPLAEILAPLARRILLVPVNSERTLHPAELFPACRAANPNASVEVCESLAEALARSKDEPFLLITGSLYLIGEAMERLQLLPRPPGDERGLNEWTARK